MSPLYMQAFPFLYLLVLACLYVFASLDGEEHKFFAFQTCLLLLLLLLLGGTVQRSPHGCFCFIEGWVQILTGHELG